MSVPKRARVDVASVPTSASWVPIGRESNPAPSGSVALALELLLPAPAPFPVSRAAIYLVDAASRASPPHLLADVVPCAALAAAACAPCARALRPLVSSGLWLHGDSSGALLLAPSPEVFFVSSDAGGDAIADEGVRVVLRTAHGGIVRGASDRSRIAVRSTRPPAGAGPDPSEVFTLAHSSWSAGGGGALSLSIPSLSTLVGVCRGGQGGGGGGDGNGDGVDGGVPRLIQFPDSGVGAGVGAGSEADDVERAYFRPRFRDAMKDVLTRVAAPGVTSVDATAAAVSTTSLLAALGVPACVASLGEAGRGARARVERVDVAAPWLGATPRRAVVKSLPWDARVVSEVEAHAAVSALCGQAELSAGSDVALPLVLPLAIVRDARDAHLNFPDAGDLLLDARGGAGGGDVRVSLRAAGAALEGAALLHSLGRLYCDIHAGNVLAADCSRAQWSVALIDLGSSVRLTAGGAGGGASYTGPTRGGRWDAMPPEQFGPGKWAEGVVTLTPASDVFSAGTLLATAVGGRAPFAPPDGERLRAEPARTHASRSIPGGVRASQLVVDRLSPELGGWIDTATHPDPAARFSDAGAALLALVNASE